ncbi:hypothetical protein D9758_008278 [Tetrapyrgos nigripes]|uniref:LisH domain-containing protein n=1 Tax=Tetrapyrgos nigripes TaxID=182062 RepID=A0A8H5LFI7_9AGAR|nr:hypothetical protein D9758_008278 [Tetrapyrgos nigripes]
MDYSKYDRDIQPPEINWLIYNYLKESGFDNTAWTLKKEAHLENRPCTSIHVWRGELVELLLKSLVYIDTELHWHLEREGDSCRNPIPLLEWRRHKCSEPRHQLGPSNDNQSRRQRPQEPSGDKETQQRQIRPLPERARGDAGSGQQGAHGRGSNAILTPASVSNGLPSHRAHQPVNMVPLIPILEDDELPDPGNTKGCRNSQSSSTTARILERPEDELPLDFSDEIGRH